ncbi:MAG: alpha/beta hydrolase [Bacilli bacterium]|nr:alpha/beta hydrolase [Bacilli bacterium]
MQSFGAIITKFLIRLAKKKQFWSKDGEEFLKAMSLREQKIPDVEKIHSKDKMFILNKEFSYDVVEIIPQGTKEEDINKVVIFFHGGAFINEISLYHYKFLLESIKGINCQAIVPIYPLAPNASHEEVYQYASDVYQRYQDKDVILMGDSAGATLAVGLTMMLRNQKKKLPSKLILVSPFMDSTLSDGRIAKLAEKDPFLAVLGLRMAGKMFAKELKITDYLVSPIYGNYDNFPETIIFTGTYDILNIDAKNLKDKLNDKKIPCKYYEYQKMIHDFPLFFGREAGEVRKKINDEINR